MSFMILTNLANIFLNRKKTELTVMRINGFSIKQTKGYLARESVITTAAGVAIGVLAGAIAAPFIIKLMEQPDIQFVRTFQSVCMGDSGCHRSAVLYDNQQPRLQKGEGSQLQGRS